MSCIGVILAVFMFLLGLITLPLGLVFWVLGWFIIYNLGKK